MFPQNTLLADRPLIQNAVYEFSKLFNVFHMFICHGKFLKFCFQTAERILH